MARSAVFLVRLSKPSAQTVTVAYATAAGTATAGSDFTSVSGTISFSPGKTLAQVIVPVADNSAGEKEEQFTLVLSSPSNATLANTTGKCVIPATALTSLPVATINNITVASA